MIDGISINFHAGHDASIAHRQADILEELEKDYIIQLNYRHIRHPKAYESYSLMMNHATATSKYEWMIFINDRTIPTIDEARKMIKHVTEDGFACSFMYNVGYMMYSKELIRTIGNWDSRFKGGGWEDRDFVYRTCMADLALYESQEGNYNYGQPKSPLQDLNSKCQYSQPHWDAKWDQKYDDAIVRMIPEEENIAWNLMLGEHKPEISSTWNKWSDSVLNINYDRPNSGVSASSMIRGRKVVDKQDVLHLLK